MAAPRQDPETGGRSLAEILREAGIESPTRGRRRRDDADDTGIRQRRAAAEGEADTGGIGGRPYGRRASDLHVAERAADPVTAAIPGVRPSGKPGVPGAAAQTGVVGERRPDERRTPERRAGDQRAGGDRRQGDRRRDDSTGRVADRRVDENRSTGRVADRPLDKDRSTGRVADRPLDDDRSTGRVGDRRQADRRLADRRADDRRLGERLLENRRATGSAAAAPTAEERRPGGVPAPAASREDNPSTGPIPVVADDLEAEDLDSTPKESALAWLRFAGELVIALAAGVGIFFLFTVIWEMVPHLAVVVAPLAVTGLVAGVGAYRHKMAREPVGPKLLAVLVFAGTLLTVAPAASLIATG
ncbi:hypothetical protein [Geodermatophilus sp. URMC 64]